MSKLICVGVILLAVCYARLGHVQTVEKAVAKRTALPDASVCEPDPTPPDPDGGQG